MGNQSDTRGTTGSENREDMNRQGNEKQPGKNTQMNNNQSKSSPQSSSSSGRPGGMREGEPNGPQHTNAGNTGVGSGQISPKTQGQQVPSRHSGSSGGSEHKS